MKKITIESKNNKNKNFNTNNKNQNSNHFLSPLLFSFHLLSIPESYSSIVQNLRHQKPNPRRISNSQVLALTMEVSVYL